VWTIQRAGSRNPGVMTTAPVSHDPIAAHASSSSGPAAAKIAPQTPPPRRSEALAALTIASTGSSVMSPLAASIVMLEITLAIVRRLVRMSVGLAAAFVVAAATPASAAPAWSVVPPVAGAQYGRLDAVSCSSTTSCFDVGIADYPNGTSPKITERWNGTSWRLVASPNPAGATSSQFTSVHCLSGTSCVAVGQYTTPAYVTKTLVERWNGTAWSIIASPNPTTSAVTGLASVQCVSATFCVAVGNYYVTSSDSTNEKTLVEQWNGTSWKIVSSPNQTGAVDSGFNGVSCTSATSCFAVGQYDTDVLTRTLVERWDGSKWSIVASPNRGSAPNELSGVVCPTTTSCVAVGSAGGTLIERWNGSTWSLMTSPNPAGATASSLTGVSCPSATRCYAAGDFFKSSSPTRLVETWNGASWSIVSTPAPAGTIRSSLSGVSCSTTTNCFAVGEYRLGPSRRPLIERFS